MPGLGSAHGSQWLHVLEPARGKIGAWTIDAAHTLTIANKAPGAARATAVDGNGNGLKLKTEKSQLIIDMSALPQYITLKRGIKLK